MDGGSRLVDSITLVQRKGSQEIKYDHPTAQMWSARSEPAKVNPRPSIENLRAPASQSTMSGGHPPTIALSTEHNASKMLLFCGTSIFAIIGET